MIPRRHRIGGLARLRLAAAVQLVVILLAAPAVRADTAAELRGAAEQLHRAEFARAAQIAGEIAHRGTPLDRGDRAEAWRIYGLALVFLDRRPEAERALLAFLRLEPDAVLDPTLVPPEAIRFFDEVRAEHAEEIARHRPRPRRRRYGWLNLAPPAGQFQNGDRGKGWTIAGAGIALLAVNVSTFAVLRDWCGGRGNVCVVNGEDRSERARSVRTVNWVSAAGLAAVYLYGIIDGYRGLARLERDERATPGAMARGATAIDVRPTGGGALLTVGGSF